MVVAVALAAALALPAAAAEPWPTITLTSVTVKRTPVRDGFAGTVSLRFRLCLNVGPRAVLITRQVRKLAGRTKAKEAATDPLGVDLDKVYPYECVPDYRLSWAVPARFLLGGGTYYVDVHVRDGFVRVSRPVLFSMRLL